MTSSIELSPLKKACKTFFSKRLLKNVSNYLKILYVTFPNVFFNSAGSKHSIVNLFEQLTRKGRPTPLTTQIIIP